MAENKFDKEKISIVSDADVPVSYVPFTGEKNVRHTKPQEKLVAMPKVRRKYRI